jgi:hypothetical protein
MLSFLKQTGEDYYRCINCQLPMIRTLFAMLAAAWICLAFGQQEQSGCQLEPRARPGAMQPDHHLEQARCWRAAQRFGEALLAVERFLALQPGDPRGLALQEEILPLLGYRPEDGSRLDAAHSRDAPRLGGWLAMMAGYDSNANSGTDARELSLPLFRGLIVDVENKFGELRRRPSALLGSHAGFDATVPLSAQTQLQFLGIAAGRLNFNAPDYLPRNFRLQAQADHRAGNLRYGLWLETDQRWINRYQSLDARTAGVRVSAPAWQEYEIGVFGAETRNRIPIFGLRTSEQRIGLSLRHATLPIRVSAFLGAERAAGEMKMLDRDLQGIAADYSILVGPGRLDVSAQTTRSAYVQFSQLFLSHRLDRFREVQVSYEYALSPAWSVTPRLIVQQNLSNVSLTHFSRYQILAELRWKF